MRAPGRIHRWVWHTLAHMPSFPLRQRRRRSHKSMAPNRLLLRLEECERRELPGSILAVGAFADVAVVGQVANLPEPASAGWQPAPRGDFAGDIAGDRDYNNFSAESARGPLDAAETAPEARPAMNQFAIEQSQSIAPAAVAEPEPPLANPLQLGELNDVLALDPLGLNVFTIGNTSSGSLAPTGGEGGGEGVTGGGSLASGIALSSAAGDSSGTPSAMFVSASGDSSTPAVSSGSTNTRTVNPSAGVIASSSTSVTNTAGTLTSSTSPTPPPSKPKPKPDALYILDANTATSVLSGVTQHSFSTWAMDLRAQVTGGTVSTYSWSLTNAPDATNVSGSSSYRLQFSWASFTGAVRTDSITLTTTNTDQSHQSQTITFKVNATNSPAYAATPPMTVSSWPTVVTPDEMDHQATVGMTKYYKLGLATGELFTQHMLPAYTPHAQACACTQGSLELDDNILAASNPDGAPLHLVYSSLAANALPMFIDRFQIDPTQAAPPTIKATLTFNGTQYASVWYTTSALNPGDIVEIPLQADAHCPPFRNGCHFSSLNG